MRGRLRAGGAIRGLIVLVFLVIAAACGAGGSPAATGPLPAGTAAQPQGQPVRPGTGGAAATPGGGDAPVPGEHIVRTGTLMLEVKDLQGTLPRARDLVAGLGGYVSGSEESNKGDHQVASITYRIPVERWQDALNGLRGLADKVIQETTQSEEVTAQIVDLDARLANLRASETSLRGIMERAANTAEVLAVQDKLTAVREQIERLQASRSALAGRAALATLTAQWSTPAVAAVAEVNSGWDFGREVDRALAQTVQAGQALASFLVWFVLVGVPVFGPILLLAVVGTVLYRRWAAKRPERPQQTGWGPAPRGPGSWQPASGPSWSSAPPAAAAGPSTGEVGTTAAQRPSTEALATEGTNADQTGPDPDPETGRSTLG